MGISIVKFNGEVLIDTSGTTVTPQTLAEGVTAIDKKGEVITGTMKSAESEIAAAIAASY